MPQRRRGQRRPNRGRFPRKNQIVFHRGHRINVPNHPTEFCSVPWWPLTVRLNNPTTTITMGGIYNAMVAQLTGLSFFGATLNIRLLAIEIWGPIPATNTPLAVIYRDVFDDIIGVSPSGAQGILEEVTNYADQVNRARTGYVYSSAQQQKSLFLTTGQGNVVVSLSGAGDGSVAYLRILWRPYIGGAPPSDPSDVEGFESVSACGCTQQRKNHRPDV